MQQANFAAERSTLDRVTLSEWGFLGGPPPRGLRAPRPCGNSPAPRQRQNPWRPRASQGQPPIKHIYKANGVESAPSVDERNRSAARRASVPQPNGLAGPTAAEPSARLDGERALARLPWQTKTVKTVDSNGKIGSRGAIGRLRRERSRPSESVSGPSGWGARPARRRQRARSGDRRVGERERQGPSRTLGPVPVLSEGPWRESARHFRSPRAGRSQGPRCPVTRTAARRRVPYVSRKHPGPGAALTRPKWIATDLSPQRRGRKEGTFPTGTIVCLSTQARWKRPSRRRLLRRNERGGAGAGAGAGALGGPGPSAAGSRPYESRFAVGGRAGSESLVPVETGRAARAPPHPRLPVPVLIRGGSGPSSRLGGAGRRRAAIGPRRSGPARAALRIIRVIGTASEGRDLRRPAAGAVVRWGFGFQQPKRAPETSV